MLKDLGGELLHLGRLLESLARDELLQVEVNGDLLLVEDEVHKEEVVDGHERDGVDEAAGVEEGLELIVSLVLLDVLLQFVHVEVSFSVPLLFLEQLQVLELILPCEAPVKIVLSCLEWSVVDNGKDVRVGNGGID